MEFVGRIRGVVDQAALLIGGRTGMVATALLVAGLALGVHSMAVAENGSLEGMTICVYFPYGGNPEEFFPGMPQLCLGELHQGDCLLDREIDLLTCSAIAEYVRRVGFPLPENLVSYLDEMINAFRLAYRLSF